jgi:hypothetical protein
MVTREAIKRLFSRAVTLYRRGKFSQAARLFRKVASTGGTLGKKAEKYLAEIAVAEGLSVADQRRPEEGVFRLAITLESDEVRDVFEVLAADIVDVAAPSATASAAIAEAIRRLEAWRACLKARQRGLSWAEQIGLLGELMVLRILGAEIGFAQAIEAWQGPLDGIHDFSRLGVAIEVKTVLGTGNLLQISHLGQLESIGLSSLAIARARLREDRNGKSLPSTVIEVRDDIIRSAPAALSVFNERLMRAGYLELDAALYDGSSLLLHEIYGYDVADGFPRLTASTVPAGIVDGNYTIDERSISGFRLDAARLRGVMQSMNGGHQ